MNVKEYAFAVGIGAAVGAGIALLFAPQSGAKTRKNLQRGAEDASGYLGEVAETLKKQAEDLAAQAEKLAMRTKGAAFPAIDQAINQAGDVIAGALKTASSLAK